MVELEESEELELGSDCVAIVSFFFFFSSGLFFGVRDARSLAMQSFVIRRFVMSNVIGVRRVSSLDDLNVVLSVASLEVKIYGGRMTPTLQIGQTS